MADFFRSTVLPAVKLDDFTPDYETRVAAISAINASNAVAEQEQKTAELAASLAAKTAPAPSTGSGSSSSSSSSEKEKTAAQEEIQAAIDKNMLEQAVAADKYFLITKEADRNVIRAANGETVTIEEPDMSGVANADGTWPIKTWQITKAATLKKLNGDSKSTTKSLEDIDGTYLFTLDAIDARYKKEYPSMEISADRVATYTGANSAAVIKSFNADCARATEQRDKEILEISKELETVPPNQGLNIEPHTIAIYAPGYCMQDGCCLELAYYTLRSAAKAIEDSSEAIVKEDLKDLFDKDADWKSRIDESLSKETQLYNEAAATANVQAVSDYKAAYMKAITYNKSATGQVTIAKGTMPNMADYETTKYLSDNDSYLAEYNAQKEITASLRTEYAEFTKTFNEQKAISLAKALESAKNYRYLLDKCSFQPLTPEWMSDMARATLKYGSKAVSAITTSVVAVYKEAFECIDNIASGITTALDYASSLQDKLNAYLGIEGLCSLNPFGGTLGCPNCPMKENCGSKRNSLTSKIASATAESKFLSSLKGALGLKDGQLLGNLLRCAAALTSNVRSVLPSVMDFSVGKGLASTLGTTGSILKQQNFPNFNTKVSDCISNISGGSEITSAINLLNTTAASPARVLQSNVPGLNIQGFDLSKIDHVSSNNNFASTVLGEKAELASALSNSIDVEQPSGSTKYYDGRYIDVDSADTRLKKLNKLGVALS